MKDAVAENADKCKWMESSQSLPVDVYIEIITLVIYVRAYTPVVQDKSPSKLYTLTFHYSELNIPMSCRCSIHAYLYYNYTSHGAILFGVYTDKLIHCCCNIIDKTQNLHDL